jgi:hypothetical protein
MQAGSNSDEPYYNRQFLGKAAWIPITMAKATAGADFPVDFRFLATVVPINWPRKYLSPSLQLRKLMT